MENRKMDKETVEFFGQAAGLAAFGGLIRAIKSELSWYEAILNSLMAGLFMLGVGAIMQHFGATNNVIFFSSGIIGVNANFFLEWWYRLSAAFFTYIQKKIEK